MQRPLRFCLILLFFAITAKAQNPCEISASTLKGCSPLPVEFKDSTTNTSPVVSYQWNFGDGDSSNQANPTHIYSNAGSYSAKVTITFQNGTTCTVSLSKPIHVYHNPNVDFTVNNNQPIILCSRGDSICFADKSSAGADKAPLVSWVWTFGDGGSSTRENPCYTYTDSGYYQVTLQVKDSNGCTKFIQKTISVRYTTDLGINVIPKFHMYLAYDCKKNVQTVTFTNTTDTAGQFITNFMWNFGDGTGDTCNLQTPACLAKWTGFQHVYSVQGVYEPTLTIENKYGCIGSVTVDTPIILQPYILKDSIFPNFKACFILDSMAIFSVPYHPLALGYYWDYGDPYRRDPGVSHDDNHIYKMPGVYTIHVHVVIGSCTYDTTNCKAVQLLGPIALIMPVKGNKQAWDSVPPNGSFLISPSKYSSYFDTTCLSPGYARYYTYKSVLITKGEPVYDNCIVDTIKTFQKDSLYLCNGKKTPNILLSYQKHVDYYKDTTEQKATLHYWLKGDPIPTGDVYSDTPFVNRPLYMDDTNLFSLRCQAPQKITFTNFSEKYRGYYAVDNFPLEYPSSCKNKSYPYASDSLTYFWDFKEGNPSTSTTASPVITDRFSSEKLPTHLFRKDGCYWVILTVSDTATDCSDKDSIPVVLQEPDAGWDTSSYRNIKDMTSLIQDSLPSNGPRRGMIIRGKPCIDSVQTIDLKEILPSCFQRNFNMAFDSARDAVSCSNIVKWKWLDKDTIANKMDYSYDYNNATDTGWKTIGLVVTNNFNCTDTVWYHDYKYIHGTYAAIGYSAAHACLGDTLRFWPAMPKQLGIKTFTYYFAEMLDYGDTIAKPTPQTARYKVIKEPNGKYDTATSTVHNRLWGIDDGPTNNFNYLTDTNSIVIPYIGHVLITSVAVSRFGCSDTVRTQLTVGDYTDFGEDNTVLCTNDTVHFHGIAQYFVPFAQFGYSTGYDPHNYWNDSITRPRRREKMEWDFNGDSIIDATGTNPSYVYTKPGRYTVVMYTIDSNGCVQTLTRKNLINVIGDSAYFTIGYPGGTRYCSGSHLFQFIDSSHVIKPFKDSLNTYKIYSWTWNFGDGSPSLTVTDTTKKNAAHVYVKNGDYTVTLVIHTAPGTGVTQHGCVDTFRRVIHILGPTADFSIIGTTKGCVPFTIAVKDKSIKATIREWILGDSTSVTSYGDSIVYLTYHKPGVWCPQFSVADSLTDSTGKQLYCTDIYPVPKCLIQVQVWDTNKQKLTASDTLICLGKDSVFFKSIPDTGYSAWTLHFGTGDSATNTKPNFSYLYTKTGKYHLTVNGSGAHCPDTSSINVHVIDVKSYFTVDTAKNDTPVFSFINRSIGGVRYTWDFGDGSDSVSTNSTQEISHEFIKAGISNICLTAYNEKGCAARYCDTIHIDTFLYIPNVFTPNGDAHNPNFKILIYGNLAYHLDIYNRWGQKVFHSDDKANTWDGINHNSGVPYPEGTYYYVFTYRFIGSKNEEANGAVTLIR